MILDPYVEFEFGLKPKRVGWSMLVMTSRLIGLFLFQK